MASTSAAADRPLRPPPPPSSPPRKYTFNSSSILSLSSNRALCTRLPDIAHLDSLKHSVPVITSKRKAANDGLSAAEERKRVPNAQHGLLFISYLQDEDESSAGLSLSNDVDYEPCPPWDFHYTNGYLQSQAMKELDAIRRKYLGWPRPASDFAKLQTPPRAMQGHIRRCECGDGPDGVEECVAQQCQCQEMARQLDPERYTTKELAGKFAYNSEGRLRKDGALLFPNLVILECTDACGCDQDCPNRVVQRGRQVPLDLFKTEKMGWGIRARKAVKEGTFITLYAGELITNNEAEERALVYDERLSTTYIMDIEPYVVKAVEETPQLIDDIREVPEALANDDVAKAKLEQLFAADRDHSIDAGLFGNFSRFFNHSCDPNMSIYHVYTDPVFDISRAWQAFFTRRDVKEGEELTFSYSSIPDDPDQAQALMDEMEREDTDEAQVHLKSPKKTTTTSSAAQSSLAEVSEAGPTLKLFAKKCYCGAANCQGIIWDKPPPGNAPAAPVKTADEGMGENVDENQPEEGAEREASARSPSAKSSTRGPSVEKLDQEPILDQQPIVIDDDDEDDDYEDEDADEEE